jgi:hypothetical protein
MAKKTHYECDICGESCPREYKVLFPDHGLFVLAAAFAAGTKVAKRDAEDRKHVCGGCVKKRINGEI